MQYACPMANAHTRAIRHTIYATYDDARTRDFNNNNNAQGPSAQLNKDE